MTQLAGNDTSVTLLANVFKEISLVEVFNMESAAILKIVKAPLRPFWEVHSEYSSSKLVHFFKPIKKIKVKKNGQGS